MTTKAVAASLRALLEGVFDYAGLFPPARLGMADTVRRYAEYLDGERAWMLGRLIVPAARLTEFEAVAERLLPRDVGAEPWEISALTAPAADTGFEADLERIAEFNEVHLNSTMGLAAIGVIELEAATTAAIDRALELVPEPIMAFMELPVDTDPRGLIAALAGSGAGAKVRTGGVEPAAYPAPADLARFVGACASADVPFKATAGLHHPLRHRNESVGADEFGFLNLLTAGALSRRRSLDDRSLIEVLTDPDASAFTFDDSGLAWGTSDVSLEWIEVARLGYPAAIGSCSFTEPIEDLQGLGLL